MTHDEIIVIGGCGTVGSLMARVLRANSTPVIVSDIRNETPLHPIFKKEGIRLDLGGHDMKLLENAKAIAVAPSLMDNKKIRSILDGLNANIITVDDILDTCKVKKPVIGVTGTNGKTTTTNMIKNILKKANYKVPEHHLNIQGNTEYIPALQARLDGDVAVVEIGTSGVPGEIRRSATDSEVKIGVITNISRDHLSSSKDFKKYIGCKKEMIDVADLLILNADDPIVANFAEGLPPEKITFYGICNLKSKFETFPEDRECPNCGRPLYYHERFLGHLGDYECPCGYKRPSINVKAINVTMDSFTLKIGDKKAPIKLENRGLFNVYNALAAAAATSKFGITFKYIINGIKSFKGTKGRFEILSIKPRIIVDYAHNPGGVRAIMQFLKHEKGQGKLVVVNTIASESGVEGDREIASILSEADIVIPASYAARKASDFIKSQVINIESSKKETKSGTLGASKEQVKEAIKIALENLDEKDTLLIIGEGGYKYGEKTIKKLTS